MAVSLPPFSSVKVSTETFKASAFTVVTRSNPYRQRASASAQLTVKALVWLSARYSAPRAPAVSPHCNPQPETPEAESQPSGSEPGRSSSCCGSKNPPRSPLGVMAVGGLADSQVARSSTGRPRPACKPSSRALAGGAWGATRSGHTAKAAH